MTAPETSASRIVARLLREGWILVRHGSRHDVYGKPGHPPVQVPRHRTVTPGVARSIAKAAGW